MEYGNTQWLWQWEQVRRHLVHSDPTVVCFPTFPIPILGSHSLGSNLPERERALISPGALHLCVQGPTPGRLYTISFQLNQEGSMSLYECFHFGSVG